MASIHSHKVEAFVDGAWVDISTYVAAAQRVTIRRGSASEQGHAGPGALMLTLFNSDHRFSNRSPGSPWFGLLGRNTPIRVLYLISGSTTPATTDTFTRTQLEEWGESSSGHDWFHVTSRLAAFSVNGSSGLAVVDVANQSRTALLTGVDFADVNAAVTWSCITPTGGPIHPGNLMLRNSRRDNFLLARCTVNTDATITLSVRAHVNGTESELATATSAITHAGAGTPLRVRAVLDGNRLNMRLWNPAGAEPSTWDIELADCVMLTPGTVGIYSGVASGNLDFPVTFTYDNFESTGTEWLTRFHGEIASWKPTSDETGNLLLMEVEGAGILRRLTQGARALHSPVYQCITSFVNDSWLIDYWPLEDGTDSTQVASGNGGTAGTFVGTVNFASYSDGPGTDPIAVLDDTSMITLPVRSYTDTGQVKVISMWHIPSGTVPNNTVLLRIFGTGTARRWDLFYTTGGGLGLTAYNDVGVAIDSTGGVAFGIDNDHFYLAIELTQDGATVDNLILTQIIDVPGVAAGTNQFTDSFTCTLGTITQIMVAPVGAAGDAAVGHVALANYTGAFHYMQVGDSDDLATWGYFREPAARRFARLCTENRVAFELYGNANESTTMGVQRSGRLLDLLHECTDAEQGILYESRHALGLAFRTREALYNQAASTVSYDDEHLSLPFGPIEDDQHIHNRVEVARQGGSRSTRTQLTGPLSIHEPPTGVGTYDRGTITLNLEEDDQTALLAAWIRFLGTWDELRYPALSVELARQQWQANIALTRFLLGLDSGRMLLLDELPDWLPPDSPMLLVRGYTERFWKFNHEMTLNLAPGWPYEVWQLDTAGSVLALGIDASDTVLKITTTLGPAWSMTEEPYHIQIAATGEAMTVTDMTTAAATFVAQGTSTHADNAAISPGMVAGVQEGDLNLIFAAIRNSGTGTVNDIPGYVTIFEFGNIKLAGRHHITGDVSPTVTFTGGVAGATTSARMFSFRNLSMGLGSGTKPVPAVATLLNASAANIAYPALSVERDACVVLYMGWKQDDFTSIATIAGANEIIDSPTTTGDDQGIVVDYVIQTSAADIPAGSFTVTGGANAISRGVTLALRPLQTASVTRATHGTASAATAQAAITGWRMGVIGL